MANISNYLEEALLNHVFRNTAYTMPGATLYVAIFPTTKDTAELEANDKTGEIVAYDEATRPSVSFAAPSQVGGKATIESSGGVEFTDMPEVNVGYAAIMDGNTKTEGNILYWMPLTDSKQTNAGDTFTFPEGDIVLDLD